MIGKGNGRRRGEGETVLSIPGEAEGEEDTVLNVAQAFGELTTAEKEEVRELLQPMAFFKCQKALFDSQCVKMIKSTAEAL